MIDVVLMLALGLQSSGDDPFLRLRQDWARNLHEKHVDASVAEYAADAEFLQPDGQRVKGTDALRKLFENITKTFDSDLTFTPLRVETSGDLTYDSGTYRETLVTGHGREPGDAGKLSDGVPARERRLVADRGAGVDGRAG